MDEINKALGAFIGLAVGDALGQPVEGNTYNEIQDKYGYITDFISKDAAVSDDTEYALFNARLLLKYGKEITSEKIAKEWLDKIAVQTEGFSGAGFSEMATIENLRSGMRPPSSGKHIHSWSDGLAMRVAPFGIYFWGHPDRAAEIAEIDGQVSHSGEGIMGGRLVAAAISIAMKTNDYQEILTESLKHISKDSWTYRSVRKGISIGEQFSNMKEALPVLYEELVYDCYPWADLAPEALGLSFGILASTRCTFVDSVLGGVNIGRDTDTNAAITGAIAGAFQGIEKIPVAWKDKITPARGSCIKTVKGLSIGDITEKLMERKGDNDGL